MKFSAAAVLAAVAGAQAWSNVTYTTEVVTALTTYCPFATHVTHNGQTYTVTEVRRAPDRGRGVCCRALRRRVHPAANAHGIRQLMMPSPGSSIDTCHEAAAQSLVQTSSQLTFDNRPPPSPSPTALARSPSPSAPPRRSSATPGMSQDVALKRDRESVY